MFGVNEETLITLQLLEVFDDGDMKRYDWHREQGHLQTEDQERTTYESVDVNGRCPLHLLCFKGYASFALRLVQRYKELEISLHLEDDKGNTPLNLLCSHGYDSPSEKKEYRDFLKRKYLVIQSLVSSREDLKKSVQPKRNNPMHWAMYYGDIDSGIFFFRKYPFIILKKNEKGKTALEIAFEKVIISSNKKNSKELIKNVLGAFLFYVFKEVGEGGGNQADTEAVEEEEPEDEDTPMGDRKLNFLEPRDMVKFQKIKNLLKEETIYDTQKLFAKLDLERMAITHVRKVFKGVNLMGIFGKENNVDMEQAEESNANPFTNIFSQKQGGDEEGVNIYEEEQPNEEEPGEAEGEGQGDEHPTEEPEENVEDVEINEEDLDNNEEALSEDLDKTISEDSLSVNSKDTQNESVKGSVNESDEENINTLLNDPLLKDPDNQILTIIDPRKVNIDKDKYLLLLHRLLVLAVYIKDIKVVKLLIDNFGVNPFFRCVRGKSAFHMAAHKGRPIIMKYFLTRKFQYIGSEKKVKLKKMIEIRDDHLNTPLHLAIREGDTQIVDSLVELGANTESYNYKNWTPFEMSVKIKMLKRAKAKAKFDEKTYIDSLEGYFDPNFYHNEAWEHVTEDYEYLMVGRDLSDKPRETILYKQLHRIQKDWNKQIKVKFFIPMDHQVKNYFRYYYIIKMKRECTRKMSDFLNLKLFNHKRGYITQYLKEEATQFEPLRAFDIHKILMFILNEEFSIEYYMKKGIIEDHFPLHQFKTRLQIKTLWNVQKYKTLFQNLAPKVSPQALMPYNSIAFYYGCDFALYLSFNSVYTSYLMLLSFIGIIFYVLLFAVAGFSGLKDPYNNFLVPSYILFVSIWVTIAYEKWAQREQEISYIWNTLNFKQKLQTLPEYDGIYIIDTVTKGVRLQDPFPTRYRKIITNIPLIVIGLVLIVANFFVFTFINDEIKKKTDYDPEILKSVYEVSAGIANGAVIFIFSVLYNFICIKAVAWENHRYWNTQNNSLVIKTFVFDFTLAYINLFYFAFVDKDFGLMANNFISLMITKNILFNVKTNLVPYLIYLVRKRFMMRKWKENRSLFKKQLLEEEGLTQYAIEESSSNKKEKKKAKKLFESLDPLVQRKLLKMEKRLILQEQIERTMIMSKLPDLRLVWTNYAIQFGYISFFSLVFPLAPLIGCLLNIVDLMFTYFALTDHIQRKICLEQGSIGIWKYIFLLMSFISLFTNLGIIVFADQGFIDLLNKMGVPADWQGDKFVIIYLAIAEHIIFLVKFLLAVTIVDMPRWIREEIVQMENREELDNEVTKRELLQIHNKRKMEKKYEEMKTGVLTHFQGMLNLNIKEKED